MRKAGIVIFILILRGLVVRVQDFSRCLPERNIVPAHDEHYQWLLFPASAEGVIGCQRREIVPAVNITVFAA